MVGFSSECRGLAMTASSGLGSSSFSLIGTLISGKRDGDCLRTTEGLSLGGGQQKATSAGLCLFGGHFTSISLEI